MRKVAAFVRSLDLSLFHKSIKSRQGRAGPSSTDPELLVSLWLYACIRGIGSTRELARRCGGPESSRSFEWLCGGVGVKRISQDGVRVRGGAGAGSFRRESSMRRLLEESKEQVERLRRQMDDPEYSAGLSAKQKSAGLRAARKKQQGLEQAIAQFPQLKKKQEAAGKQAGNGERGKQIRRKEPRVSTSDPQARVMKMPNGGFNPAVNVQLASDTRSRAIVGVEVSNEGSDSAGLSEPMREQVQARTGKKVGQHLLDGGYMKIDDIDRAYGQGKQVYKQRASTSETVNADLRSHRGLVQLTVRGLKKARCAALWCALAYNVMHFAAALLS